jgi:hypothetical protein
VEMLGINLIRNIVLINDVNELRVNVKAIGLRVGHLGNVAKGE